MSDQGKIEKIHKLDTKHKTASIIKLMEGKHSDTEVICAALEALGDIADEDSLNEITHYLEHEDPAIRTKACCVAAKLNTDYLNTRVRYQMSQEKDPEVKKAIQEALVMPTHCEPYIGLLRQTFSYIRCRLNYFNLTLLSPFRASENRRPLLFSGNVRCQVDFRNQPHGAAPGSKPGSSRKAFSAGIRQLQEYRISNNLHFPHSDIQ